MSATIGTASGNATRFRAVHEADWAELDRIVTLIERKSITALDDDALLALPLLYRATLSSLSVARQTSLDQALIQYLEQLSTRAYFQIYGVSEGVWRQIARFFAHGWPDAVRALWRETLAALLLTLVGAAAGALMVAHDPAWFYSIIPDGLAQGRDPAASAPALRHVLYDSGGDHPLTVMATALFTHNAQIALFAFALGFAFGVPTALLLLYNGMMLGAFFALYAARGLGFEFGGWVMIHGTTELFAIILAGAAGFRIGGALAFPGDLSRSESAVVAGRTAALVVAGVVVMLLVAGLIEGIGRQTVLVDAKRYAIAVTALAGWLVFFYLPRGQRDLG